MPTYNIDWKLSMSISVIPGIDYISLQVPGTRIQMRDIFTLISCYDLYDDEASNLSRSYTGVPH